MTTLRWMVAVTALVWCAGAVGGAFASDPKAIQLFTGNAHGTDIFNSEHKAELEKMLLDLIKGAAGR